MEGNFCQKTSLCELNSNTITEYKTEALQTCHNQIHPEPSVQSTEGDDMVWSSLPKPLNIYSFYVPNGIDIECVIMDYY